MVGHVLIGMNFFGSCVMRIDSFLIIEVHCQRGDFGMMHEKFLP